VLSSARFATSSSSSRSPSRAVLCSTITNRRSSKHGKNSITITITRTRTRTRTRTTTTNARASTNARSDSNNNKQQQQLSDENAIIIIGLGARGCSVVDELQAKNSLQKSTTMFWSISADVQALTNTKSQNRWRLPPSAADVPQSAVIDNARSAAQSVLLSVDALVNVENSSRNGKEDDDSKSNKNNSKSNKNKNNDERVHICIVCASGEAGGEAGILFVKELFKSKNITSEKRQRLPGFWGGQETPNGCTVSVHAIAPFDFEGRRKRDDSLNFLKICSRKKAADSVVVIAQRDSQALEGEPMTLESASELANDFCRWSVLNTSRDLRRKSTFWDARVNGENERCGILDEQNAFKNQISSKSLREINAENLSKSADGGCGIAVIGCAVEQLKTYGTEDEQIASAVISAVKKAAEGSPFLDPSQALGEKCKHLMCQISTPRGVLGPLARKEITKNLASFVDPMKCGVTIALAPAENTVGSIELSLYAISNFETIADRFTMRQSQIALRKLNDRNLPDAMMNNLDMRKKRLDWSATDDVIFSKVIAVKAAADTNTNSTNNNKKGNNAAVSDGNKVVVDSIFDKALMSVDETDDETLLEAGDLLANIEGGGSQDTPQHSNIDPFQTTDEAFDLESDLVNNNENDLLKVIIPGELTGKIVLTPVRVLRPKEDESGNVVGYRAVDSVDDYDNNINEDNDDENDNDSSSSSPSYSKFSLLGWRPFSSKNDKKESNTDTKVKNRMFNVLESDREARTRPILRVEYANMCVYEGEVLEKTTKAEGSGIMRFASGDWYEGKFSNGLPDGKGKISYAKDGKVFEGVWSNGSPINGSFVDVSRSAQ